MTDPALTPTSVIHNLTASHIRHASDDDVWWIFGFVVQQMLERRPDLFTNKREVCLQAADNIEGPPDA